MKVQQIIYLSVLTISMVLSWWCNKGNKSLKLFPLLLSIAVLTEGIVNVAYFALGYTKEQYQPIYHVYIPIEYTLLASYFYLEVKNNFVKKLILISIPLFLISSFVISSNIGFEKYVGANLNAEGILLIAWSLYMLFTLEVKYNVSIFRLPIFWICLGILLYHAGTFFYNGIYNYIEHKWPTTASNLTYSVNKGLNILLYVFFSIAFVCSNQMRKYTSL